MLYYNDVMVMFDQLSTDYLGTCWYSTDVLVVLVDKDRIVHFYYYKFWCF